MEVAAITGRYYEIYDLYSLAPPSIHGASFPMRIAFKMKLLPGCAAEYRKRHDAIWPELITLLKNCGVSNYSIFLDPSSLELVGILTAPAPSALDALPSHPVMKKWWASMRDIMETNPDNSPVSVALKEVFYLE
jgi:L-rhamnose mutarotase